MNNPKFNDLLDKMKVIHDKKNADYANDTDPYSNFSFAANFAGVEKIQVYLTLLGVKAARLHELILNKKIAKNESINDTLLDFAVYAALMASDLMVKEEQECGRCGKLLIDHPSKSRCSGYEGIYTECKNCGHGEHSHNKVINVCNEIVGTAANTRQCECTRYIYS